jgi:hypothetical protein
MNTTTVMEIIKKLDSHIKAIAEEYKDVDTDPDQNVPMDPSYWITVGKEMALTDLRDHLQSFIEGEVSKIES